MANQNLNITIKAFDKTKGALGSAAKGIKAVGSAVFSMKTALAGVVGVAGLGLLVRQSLQATDALSKTASKIGTTTEELSKLRYAADLTGVSTETMDMALQRFTRRAAEAANGTGEAKAALKELGIDAEALIRMPLSERMLELADAFSESRPKAERLALAFKLFDSEGVALVNTLALGRDGLRNLFQEADELGIVMSGSAAKGVEDARDALTKLFTLFRGITAQVTAGLAPAIESFSTLLKDKVLKSIQDTSGSVEQFGRLLASEFISKIGQAIAAVGYFARSVVDFMKGAIPMLNWLRDWMDLAPIADTLTYDFANGIEDLGARIHSAGYQLRWMNGTAQEVNTTAEKGKTLMERWGDAIGKVAEAMPSLQEQMVSVATSLQNSVTQAFTDAITGAKSFGDAVKDLAKSVVDSLAKMLVQYYITQPLFQAITGAFGAPATATATPAPSFAGGGFTGSGARAGGVDGRGGFPAILHPNETVIDHTRGGGAGGVVVNQTINVTTGVQQTVRAEIQNLMPQIAESAKNAVSDSAIRGGTFAKTMRTY
jgi:hypothetical protein